MLNDLINRYLEAKRVWETQFDEDCDKASNSKEWDEYMDLTSQVICFRCSTMSELSRKAFFMLNDINLLDELSSSATEETARGFLTSLIIPEAPVDIGEDRSNGQP